MLAIEPKIDLSELVVAKRSSVSVEHLSIGRVFDPTTGHPVGLGGPVVKRRSRALPPEIVEHAQPQALIGPLDTLQSRIAASAMGKGALVVYPVYARTAAGLAGWKVVACRLGIETYERAGRTRRVLAANAFVVDWATWQRSGQNLGPALENSLRLERVEGKEAATDRLATSAVSLAIGKRAEQSNRSPDVTRIVQAVRAGERMIIGNETCQTEGEFLQLVGAALAELTEEERAHVSFASGFLRHDDGIQIVWLPDHCLADLPLDVTPLAPAEVAQLAPPLKAGVTVPAGTATSLVGGGRRLMRSIRIAVTQSLRTGEARVAVARPNKPPIDLPILLKRRWLPPNILASIIVTPDLMEALSQRIGDGDRKCADLTLMTGVIAENAGAQFEGLGTLFVQSLSPADVSGRYLTADMLNTADLVKEAIRCLDSERDRLVKAGKPLPRWLTTARRNAAALVAERDRQAARNAGSAEHKTARRK